MATASLHLIVPAGLCAVSEAGSRVTTFLRTAGLDDLTAFQIELAVVEVITNVVRHGGPNSEQVPVTLDVEISESSVKATIHDPGPPPPMAAAPKAHDPLAESGRGIEIIYAVMDKVEHVVRKSGNVIELTKYVHAPANRPGVKS